MVICRNRNHLPRPRSRAHSARRHRVRICCCRKRADTDHTSTRTTGSKRVARSGAPTGVRGHGASVVACRSTATWSSMSILVPCVLRGHTARVCRQRSSSPHTRIAEITLLFAYVRLCEDRSTARVIAGGAEAAPHRSACAIARASSAITTPSKSPGSNGNDNQGSRS